jgi:hypothetical protein
MTWTSMQQCPVPLPLNNDAHDFSTSSNRRQEMDIRAFFAIGSGEVPWIEPGCTAPHVG